MSLKGYEKMATVPPSVDNLRWLTDIADLYETSHILALWKGFMPHNSSKEKGDGMAMTLKWIAYESIRSAWNNSLIWYAKTFRPSTCYAADRT